MAADIVLDFYETINFELIDIDGYDTLFTELLEDGTYATVSDDDGHLPEDLETPIVFNVYDDNDSFQWSVTLDDSYQLKDLLDSAESTNAFLETLQKIRQPDTYKYFQNPLTNHPFLLYINHVAYKLCMLLWRSR